MEPIGPDGLAAATCETLCQVLVPMLELVLILNWKAITRPVLQMLNVLKEQVLQDASRSMSIRGRHQGMGHPVGLHVPQLPNLILNPVSNCSQSCFYKCPCFC
eukprot:2028223-Amphidinium_carterae.1